MNDSRHFDAPWAMSLKLVTALTTGILMVMMIAALANGKTPKLARMLMVSLTPVGIGAGALFMIRGYELGKDELLVERLGWRSRVSLSGLQSVVVDPRATRWSFRSCGNGGFFSFTGWYANKTLGSYRLFGTDPKRAVVLYFPNRRVVVTPEEPEVFARCLREQVGLK